MRSEAHMMRPPLFLLMLHRDEGLGAPGQAKRKRAEESAPLKKKRGLAPRDENVEEVRLKCARAPRLRRPQRETTAR